MPAKPAPASKPSLLSSLRPSRRAWIAIAVAFAIGLLLFLLIWAKQRHENEFFRVDGEPQSATGSPFEPLPVPVIDGGDNVAPAPDAPRTGGSDTQVVEAPATPPPAPPAALPDDTQPLPEQMPSQAAGGDDSAPVPTFNPAPSYPRDALRRGETGEALLRIQVGADGNVGDIDLVRSSGSRSLDRAATDAVRRWRFQPALRGGRPVDGSVEVPIAFH